METTPLTLPVIEEAKSMHRNNRNNKKSFNTISSTPKHVKSPIAVPMAAAPTTTHHD